MVSGVKYTKICFLIDCNDYYDNNVAADLCNAKGLLFEARRDGEKIDLWKLSKLKIHVCFTEHYLTNTYNCYNRSTLSSSPQTLAMSIDRGQFQSILPESGWCIFVPCISYKMNLTALLLVSWHSKHCAYQWIQYLSNELIDMRIEQSSAEENPCSVSCKFE